MPGGYVKYGETPQQALKREYLEETKIEVEPQNIIGIRFRNCRKITDATCLGESPEIQRKRL
nr:NUDIX domain-containing protein [uncultured Acetatifactor sp.]